MMLTLSYITPQHPGISHHSIYSTDIVDSTAMMEDM